MEKNSDNSICAAELGQASPEQDLSPEKLNCADFVKSTLGVNKYCNNVGTVYPSKTMCENLGDYQEQQTLSSSKPDKWQLGRYAWKLENIQPITEAFAVKGKQGLFNIPSTNFESYLKKKFTLTQVSKKSNKKSDRWYTPLHIVNLVVQVLGAIYLDPCADDGKHITAMQHYTFNDDSLTKPWYGRVYMNPPYNCPGLWMKKLQAEFESGRVTEAILLQSHFVNALVGAATDTNWLSVVLKTQPVCFWRGRIKFLDEDYKPKSSAWQSHVLVYSGENWQRFKEVFEGHGFVSVPSQFLEDKLIDEISSRKNENEKFLEDKPGDNISSRKNENEEFLEDKLIDEISSRKNENEEFLEDKLIDEISSRKNENEEFLEDKLIDEISSRKNENEEFLEDKPGDNISSRKNENEEFLEDKPGDNISSRKNENEKFLEDKPGDNISSRKNENEEFLEDKLIDEISSRKTRRCKGDGSGCIYYRTVIKKGKEYREAYYQYEVWNKGDRLVKSSKYIQKRLLSQVQRLESEKAPVKEILKLLGVVKYKN